MKRIYFLLAFFIVTTASIQSQMLWKITGNGIKKPSYIFGTHYLIPVTFLDSINGLYKAFNGCDMVVGEVVINNIDDKSKLMEAALISNDKTIKNYLPDSIYKAVDNELKAILNIELKELSLMHPSLILNLYTTELFKRLTGVSDDAQSDSYFQIVAEQKGKTVVGLETVEQHIGYLFKKEDIEDETKKLAHHILNKESYSKELLGLNKLYRQGKLEELYIFLKTTGMDGTTGKFTDQRNTAWMTQLPDLIKKNKCFITVNLLNLPGKNGLISNLQKNGFKVTPVE